MNFKWRVLVADLNPVKGSEQKGRRPVLVVSDEHFNTLMPVVTVLPITSVKEGRRVYPNEVLLPKGASGLPQDSIILAHQIRTIPKQRLKESPGSINDGKIREAVKGAMRVHLNL